MNDTTNRRVLLRRQWLTLPAGLRGTWLPLWLGVICIIALAATGETGREALRYERDALLIQQQYWRLLTGHLVHGNWQHTWLNLAGLALVVALFRGTWSARQWGCIALCSMVFIDLGFVLLMPQLHWYVGLSGVLHGLLTAGAVAWWRIEDRRLCVVLWMILLSKLAWEQWQGALPLSGDLEVIVNAHLYGAVGGLLAGLVLLRHLPLRAP